MDVNGCVIVCKIFGWIWLQCLCKVDWIYLFGVQQFVVDCVNLGVVDCNCCMKDIVVVCEVDCGVCWNVCVFVLLIVGFEVELCFL